MGYKSRGGFNIPICLKVDCLNHGIKEICDRCFRDNKYEPMPLIDKNGNDNSPYC